MIGIKKESSIDRKIPDVHHDRDQQVSSPLSQGSFPSRGIRKFLPPQHDVLLPIIADVPSVPDYLHRPESWLSCTYRSTHTSFFGKFRLGVKENGKRNKK